QLEAGNVELASQRADFRESELDATERGEAGPPGAPGTRLRLIGHRRRGRRPHPGVRRASKRANFLVPKRLNRACGRDSGALALKNLRAYLRGEPQDAVVSLDVYDRST